MHFSKQVAVQQNSTLVIVFYSRIFSCFVVVFCGNVSPNVVMLLKLFSHSKTVIVLCQKNVPPVLHLSFSAALPQQLSVQVSTFSREPLDCSRTSLNHDQRLLTGQFQLQLNKVSHHFRMYFANGSSRTVLHAEVAFEVKHNSADQFN